MKIQVETVFDCSPTGVTGHYRAGEVPFQDRTGHSVTNQQEWNRSRNQQRNWETLQQVMSLRCQLLGMTQPQRSNERWCFEFETETPGVFGQNNNLDYLARDCEGVPMIVGLLEKCSTGSQLCTQGANQNIWFKVLNS
jgi:hypothetical protein